MNKIQIILIASLAVLAETGQAQNKAAKWLAPTTFKAQEFLQPEKQYAPFTRWWWPGNDVNKEELGEAIEKADVPSYINGSLQGSSPNEYFIGDPFSSNGYGVYHKPIAKLVDKYTDGKSNDITDCSFNKLLRTVANGTPVVTWVTINMKESSVGLSWTNGDETIEWIIPEHAVLLVGFTKDEVIINDPYTGTEYNVDKDIFEDRWNSLGRQAVTISK